MGASKQRHDFTAVSYTHTSEHAGRGVVDHEDVMNFQIWKNYPGYDVIRLKVAP